MNLILQPRNFSLRDYSLCFLSFVLLLLAFPQTDFGIFTWIGLIPFFAAMDGKRPLAAFRRAYFLGILFFTGTLYWFVHVTLAGTILFMLYLALYFGFFGIGYDLASRQRLSRKMFFLPSLWVVLEFVRGHFLTGFGWVNLGHSQYKNLPIIQIADVTGVAGISFLIVMVNVLFKEIICLFGKSRERESSHREIVWTMGIVMSLLFLVLGYGRLQLAAPQGLWGLKVSVIQGNIPQEMKWEESYRQGIMAQYLALTQKAAAADSPDLIIWPETSFPSILSEAPQLFKSVRNFVTEIKIPLLLGAVTQSGDSYHNSALLISPDGNIAGQHDKLHLVPFGEYIPLRKNLPFLEDMVPIGDFTPGDEYTIFPVPLTNAFFLPHQARFAVLICFEDTIPELSRGFVQKGAGMLVNITNDAWFKDTPAPGMHLQAAVFRSVENRRSLIRAANTGVSCFIDPHGRITESVHNKQGKNTYVDGYATQFVPLEREKTFYTKYGDIFTYLCFGCILAAFIKRK